MSLNTGSIAIINPSDLVVNIFACAEHVTECMKQSPSHCPVNMFSGFCVESLRANWNNEWGVFDQVICKLLKADKSFVNDLSDSFKDKQLIADFLKKNQ